MNIQVGKEQPSARLIRKRGSGRIFIRGGVWYMRYRNNGMETTKTTGIKVDSSSDDAFDKSKTSAIAVLDKETEVLRLKDKETRLRIVKMMLEDTQEKIRDIVSGVKRNLTLSCLQELFTSSSRRQDCSKKQMEAYCRYIDILVKKVGGEVRICDIDEGLTDTFVSWLAKKPMSEKNQSTMSANTYNKHINGYEFIWDAIMGKVGVTTNPWSSIPRKKLDTNVRRSLTEDESEKMLNHSTGELRVLLAIGLYTGLRMGDAIHLKWSDIHGGAIFVEKTRKTGASVAIPLHPRLQESFKDADESSDYLTPHLALMYDTQGNSAITRKVKKVFEKCGITTSKAFDGKRSRPLCSFHSLRHTFVSRCTASGIPQAVVQALVGHASQKMTQHYTHLENKDILSAFSSMK